MSLNCRVSSVFSVYRKGCAHASVALDTPGSRSLKRLCVCVCLIFVCKLTPHQLQQQWITHKSMRASTCVRSPPRQNKEPESRGCGDAVRCNRTTHAVSHMGESDGRPFIPVRFTGARNPLGASFLHSSPPASGPPGRERARLCTKQLSNIGRRPFYKSPVRPRSVL